MANKQGFFVSARRHGACLAALAVCIIAAPAGLPAAKHGATLRLQLLDGNRLEGELLAIKGDRLILMGWSGGEARIGLDEVAEMRIERGNRVGKGVVGGLAVGFALGTLVALPATFSDSNEYSVLPIAILGGLGGGFGALLGAGAGLISGGSDRIRPRGRDAAWRAAALVRLRRLARFRDPEAGRAEPPRGQGAMAAPRPPAPEKPGEFRHWRAAVSLAQTPPDFAGNAAAMIAGFRYGEPFAPGTSRSVEMSSDDGRRSWVGLREVGMDYFISRRWAVGVRLTPFSARDGAYGRRTMNVAGNEMDASWSLDTRSRTYLLTASYSPVVADGFVRRTALRLGAGVGWHGYGIDFWESGYRWEEDDATDSAVRNYYVQAGRQDSTSLAAMAEAEVAQYFNSRWSLALQAGFRYVPLRFGPEQIIGRISRREPGSTQDFSLTIPGSTLNIGGFYAGVKIGFHF